MMRSSVPWSSSTRESGSSDLGIGAAAEGVECLHGEGVEYLHPVFGVKRRSPTSRYSNVYAQFPETISDIIAVDHPLSVGVWQRTDYCRRFDPPPNARRRGGKAGISCHEHLGSPPRANVSKRTR